MKPKEKVINRWKKAFPLAGFQPALKAPNQEAEKLARQFCPTLYSDLGLIKAEQADLAKNVGIDEETRGFLASLRNRVSSRDFAGAVDSLFLFCLGEFPTNLIGAKLAILGVDLP